MSSESLRFDFALHPRQRAGSVRFDRWPEPDFAVEMAVFPACR